jgi:hypothetical protein
MNKTIQLQSGVSLGDSIPNNKILRAAGVKNPKPGWYTVQYNGGPKIDCSNVISARRNPNGEIMVGLRIDSLGESK